MVGASVHGLVGVDAELERSATALQERTIEHHTVRVRATERAWDCPAPAAKLASRERV